MLIWIYRLVFVPAFLVLFPLHLPRLIKRGRFLTTVRQRFGFYGALFVKAREKKKSLWIQVVSVGEAQAASPLIQSLNNRRDCLLFITTTTSTAHTVLNQRFGHCSGIWIGYFPFDFFPFVANAWRSIQPDLVVLFESELWPELMHRARSSGVPVWLINARHSDKTIQWFIQFPMIARWLYGYISKALFVSRGQLERLKALSICPAEASAIGQLKFDVSLPCINQDDRQVLLSSMGFHNVQPETCIIIGASTWAGEEKILLEALQSLIDDGCDVRLILVPRHADRGHDIATEVASKGLSYTLRSQPVSSTGVIVHIADTTGEMQMLCQCAHMGLIGKSFAPHIGGQNPLELVAAGVPMVYGPSMSNFRDVCNDLEAENLSRCCLSRDEAKQSIVSLVKDASVRQKLSYRLQQWLVARKGVLSLVVDEFDGFLDHVVEETA
tara:strand:+ start:1595 stop:2914 length:1320 start_codon:yes stop_codon:yes gene_type:complete